MESTKKAVKNVMDEAEVSALRRTIHEGERKSVLSRFAERAIRKFGDGERAKLLFHKEAGRCQPPLPADVLAEIWNSAAATHNDRIKSQTENLPPAGSMKPDTFTDLGEAKVIAREYGDELRYSPATDYMHFNGIQWEEAKDYAVEIAAELTEFQLADADLMIAKSRRALIEAGLDAEAAADEMKKIGKDQNSWLTAKQAKLCSEYIEAKKYQAFALERQNWRSLRASMEICKPLVKADIHDFDSKGFLLNTPSYTYDLRHGIDGRKEHRASDFITKCTAVDPSDQGQELWDDAVNRIFLGDHELIDYVQMIAGLAAIGKVYIEALIIAYGDGRNGKSTFWNTIFHVMGSYSGKLSADTLTVGCRRNVKPELAEVFGKRLIIASELEEGQRLNTSTVKQLCSTDDIFAEKKYRSPFFFSPVHTVVLYTNHLPKVGAKDEGIWRRLIVIPFKAKFEESADHKNFSALLQEKAGPAVLKWIMEGARKVIENNFHIREPEVVRNAISSYRDQNDWMTQFLTDCCERTDDPGIGARSGELYTKYREYALHMGEYARSTTDFYSELERAGFRRIRRRNGVFVSGLRIRDETG